MGVSDFSIIDLAHKVRSIMAELRSPPVKSPVRTGARSPTCYGSAMEIDRDVVDSGTTPPESDVLRPGRSNGAPLSGRRLFASPTTLRCSTARSTVEEDDESDKQFFTPVGDNLLPEFSDSDSTSMTDSPTREDTNTPKSERILLFDREYSADLDFDSDRIWLPPGTEDEGDDEMCLFDDTEDRYEVGFYDSDSSIVSDEFVTGSPEVVQEISMGTIHTHFRALVSQLLNGEGFSSDNETCESYEGWLRIVSSLAWQVGMAMGRAHRLFTNPRPDLPVSRPIPGLPYLIGWA